MSTFPLLPFLIATCAFAHSFRHVSVLSPNLINPLSTGIVGDGNPQILPTLANPYTKGSPYGNSFSARDTMDYGTSSGRGYGPMGAFNGYGTTSYQSEDERNDIQGHPGFAATAWNYSSPWGDSAHPGPHPMWTIPPSPYGMKENDPRTVGLQSWNQSNGQTVSNFTRFGLGGTDSFSPFRQYKYQLGNIPSDIYRYGGRLGGEPIPFQHNGVIPSTVPEGMQRSNAIQRNAMNNIMPFGSTTDQVRGRSEGVIYPFGSGVKKKEDSLLLELNGRNGKRSAYRKKRKMYRENVLN